MVSFHKDYPWNILWAWHETYSSSTCSYIWIPVTEAHQMWMIQPFFLQSLCQWVCSCFLLAISFFLPSTPYLWQSNWIQYSEYFYLKCFLLTETLGNSLNGFSGECAVLFDGLKCFVFNIFIAILIEIEYIVILVSIE